jgi:cysteinyl-tRNA synthetase
MLLVCFILQCTETSEDIDYRMGMREFVQAISAYARIYDHDFIVIPQNGQELLTDNGEVTGNIVDEYIAAIDGVGREDLWYGYEQDNEPTPAAERLYMIGYLDLVGVYGIEVLAIDYCWTDSLVDDSYYKNEAKGYISFAAHRRELDSIPQYPLEPYNMNNDDIADLTHARNFLYLINPCLYNSKQEFLDDCASTAYDLLIIDLFAGSGEQLTSTDIAGLTTKSNGGQRLVIAYMSIGEAEDYRYYWLDDWSTQPPSWLSEENPEWPGNYKVEYWDEEWQSVIFGNDSSYIKRIIDAGFDGVYLDIIDAFEYFENR